MAKEHSNRCPPPARLQKTVTSLDPLEEEESEFHLPAYQYSLPAHNPRLPTNKQPKCRSRHVKCGAEMPNCSRCVQDDKPCFYAKSRRGMRDRNVPRKRVSMRESGKASPIPGAGFGGNPLAYPVGGSSSESYTGNRSASDASASPESEAHSGSGRQGDPRRLLDLYYKYVI